MWKRTGAGAAALVIAATVFAYAQEPGPGNPGGQGGGLEAPRQGQEHEMHGMHGLMGWRRNPQDMAAFAEARIAALHAGLQLNPDQEKNWPPVEQALRALAKMRIDRVSAARDQQQAPSNPLERLQRLADALSARGAALKRLADAASPLYQSLDEGQKRRLPMLVRMMRPQHGHGMWRGRGPGGMEGEFGMEQHRSGEHGMRDGKSRDEDDDDYRGPL